jgi:hypothetical protein
MAKLTEEERTFRKNGAGIPLLRALPAVVIIISICVAATNPLIWNECLGSDEAPHYRGKAGLIAATLTVPCSPYLLKGDVGSWLTFAGMWLPVPLAIVNWRWSRRLRRYWDKVRLRERESRRRRLAEKKTRSGTEISDS